MHVMITRIKQINFTSMLIDEIVQIDKKKGSAALTNTEFICDKIREIKDDLVYVSKVLNALRKKSKKFKVKEKEEKEEKKENDNSENIEKEDYKEDKKEEMS